MKPNIVFLQNSKHWIIHNETRNLSQEYTFWFNFVLKPNPVLKNTPLLTQPSFILLLLPAYNKSHLKLCQHFKYPARPLITTKYLQFPRPGSSCLLIQAASYLPCQNMNNSPSKHSQRGTIRHLSSFHAVFEGQTYGSVIQTSFPNKPLF